MLDSIFDLMKQDGYDNWQIHLGLESQNGRVSIDIPHSMADGRSAIRSLQKTFQELGPISREHPPRAKHKVPKKVDRTSFQSILPVLLGEFFPHAKRIAVGVSLEDLNLVELASAHNKVTFPVFERFELLSLADISKTKWIDRLRTKALEELKKYSLMNDRLCSSDPEARQRYYKTFSINRVDLILSYLGDIHNFAVDLEPKANQIDISVTANAVSSEIAVGFSHHSLFSFWVTSRNSAKKCYSFEVLNHYET